MDNSAFHFQILSMVTNSFPSVLTQCLIMYIHIAVPFLSQSSSILYYIFPILSQRSLSHHSPFLSQIHPSVTSLFYPKMLNLIDYPRVIRQCLQFSKFSVPTLSQSSSIMLYVLYLPSSVPYNIILSSFPIPN